MDSPSLKEQGYLPRRYVVALMAFLGMVVNYILRSNISLTIVSLVKDDVNSSNTNSSAEEVCGFTDHRDDGAKQEGEFEWDEFTQSLMTASYLWGCIWTQVPGGRMAEVFGARRVLGGALTMASLLTLLGPLTIHTSTTLFIVMRVILGLCVGVTYPSTHALLSAWSPPKERSTLAGFVYPGADVGLVVSYAMASVLITSLGWESVFYVQGGISLLWCATWFLIVADSPHVDTRITAAEKDYILDAIGDTKEKKAVPVPLRAILTSMPFWALFIANIGNNWGFYVFATELPLFMKSMLLQDIKLNAIYSSLPFLGLSIFSVIVSKVGDTLIRKNIMTTVVVRKTANTISQVGPALCLLLVTVVRCNRIATIGLFFAAITLQGAVYTGFMVNAIDIAPNFAGTVHGITNAFAVVTGSMGPMATGWLTKGQETFEQWDKVFYITAGIHAANAVFFLIFASGEVQPWNQMVTKRFERMGVRAEDSSSEWLLATGAEDHSSECVINQ